MSRVDIALQRAITEGVVQPSANQTVATVVTEPPEFPGEAPALREPAADSRRSLFWSGLVDQDAAVEAHTKLPPEISSQLASLVHTLELDPERPRTIAFVSSARGEGTTTCCASLGGFLASRRAKVLMVDANLHHPALHAVAGVAQATGLWELANSQYDLEDVVKPTAVSNLFLITSGETSDPARNSLLMPSVLRQRVLSRTPEYDFTLVDCPAVNVYEDAAVMAAACDAAILVVEGDKTPRQAAQASKARLTRARCRILGVFMNKRKFYVPKFLYDRL